MIRQGNAFSAGGGAQKMPTSPAAIAALAGNGVYRYRQFLLGGDHIIKTSNGSEYNHALSKSFADFLQMVGVAVVGWTQAAVAKAQLIHDQYALGQITKQQAQQQMADLAGKQLAAKGGAYTGALEHGAVPTVGPVNPP